MAPEFPAEVAIVCIRSRRLDVHGLHPRHHRPPARAERAPATREGKRRRRRIASSRRSATRSRTICAAPLRASAASLVWSPRTTGPSPTRPGAATSTDRRGHLTRMGHPSIRSWRSPASARTELQSRPPISPRIGRSVIEQLRSRDQGRAVTFVTGDSLLVRGDPLLLRTVLEEPPRQCVEVHPRQAEHTDRLSHRVVDGRQLLRLGQKAPASTYAIHPSIFKGETHQRLHSFEPSRAPGSG